MTTQATQCIRRHRFSREILSAVKARSQSDNWHGPMEIAEHWLVIAVCIWSSSWAWRNLDFGIAASVYVAAVFLIGGRQRALAGILHQACHGTLMSNKKLARVLGTVFGGYPVLQSYSVYKSSHVRDHHGRFGDPECDPDYVQYQRFGLCGDKLCRTSLRRHLLTILSPRSTLSYISYLLRYRIWSREEPPSKVFVRILLVAAAVGAAASFGWLGELGAYWFLPLVTTQVWIGTIAELLEHYPLIESASRADIYMSWNRQPRPIQRFLLGEKKGEGFHLVHHLFPHVPLWRLEDVDRILTGDPAYASLQRLGGPTQALSSIFTALPAR